MLLAGLRLTKWLPGIIKLRLISLDLFLNFANWPLTLEQNYCVFLEIFSTDLLRLNF